MSLAALSMFKSALTLLNKSRLLIEQYQRLPPERQQLLRQQADHLAGAITDLRTVLQRRGEARTRLQALERAREDALHPAPEFELAKALVARLREHGPVPLTELDGLAAELGADDSDDPEFTRALRIASSDGRVTVSAEPRTGDAVAAVRARDEEPATDVQERAIVSRLETAGAAGAETLATAAGVAAARDPRFRLALTRLLERGEVEWLAAGTYGLAGGRVAAMLESERANDPSIREAAARLVAAGRALAEGMKELPVRVPDAGPATPVEMTDAELAALLGEDGPPDRPA